MSVFAVIAEEVGGHHVVNELPFPAPVFGLLFLIGFAILAFVVFTYRDVANRHPEKAAAYAKTHGTHHEDRTGADH